MTAERWRRIEEVYHAALEQPPEQRRDFIAQACQGDADLSREIEELVRHEEPTGWNLPEHSSSVAAAFAPGTRLGPYEIVESIGTGGMGQVFRATDTRLGRSVAIKVSQEAFSRRFAQEARNIASLNHPNICTLYDTGPDYLVMELIEGPTLAERIRKGPLPLDEALRIAGQIAAGLAAAHEKDIVHRDLKPANIKIRPDGSVKVLDFGLAKSRAEQESGPTPDSVEIKRSGLILGTAAYMSPEQALGQEVDKRADIWSFAVVLYEMLTGLRPFGGATLSDCLATIVQKEPDLTKVPSNVRRLLGLCFEKDPKKRLRDLGDWQHLLGEEQSEQKSSGRRAVPKIAWFGIAATLIAAAGALTLWLRPAPPLHTTRFQVSLPENVYFDKYVSVSPDGQKLAFNATGDQNGLWIHNLDTLQWQRLPGTEHALSTFWSPDSRFLGFVLRGIDGSEVKKIEVAAGPPVTIYKSKGLVGKGAWSQGGDIVFGALDGGPLRRVSFNSGGADTAITAVKRARGETGHGLPVFLPDGKHFLYFIGGSPDVAGMYAGSVDASPEAQPRERILAVTTAASYVDGKLLFLRDGNLMAQPFDADRLRLGGGPTVLAEHVQAWQSSPVFSASPGVLAYRSGTDIDRHQLTWLDRQGKEIGTFGQPSLDTDVRLSPDQASASVVDGPDNAMTNIWILDFGRAMRTRFTFHPPAISPVWSPDGSQLFFSTGPQLDTISAKTADGTGPEKELLNEPGKFHYPSSVSPNGRFLLYYTMDKPRGPGVSGETWALPLNAGGENGAQPIHLLGSQFSEQRAVFSPDGRWIAYRSNESGRFEVYVRSVVTSGASGISLGKGKWQASKGNVQPTPPVWSHDDRELFYISDNDVITAVKVEAASASFRMGSPTPLFTAPCACEFDVSADGQRFLVRGAAVDGGKTAITVVLNWQADLKPR